MLDLHIKPIALALALTLITASCASSVVQIRPPYYEKLRAGDGVKIREKDGTLHAGRVGYLDKKLIVIRTSKQKIANNPVKVTQFGTSIHWETIHSLKVSGTLDSQRKLISNEEMRVHRKTNLKDKLKVNSGLLGLAAGFLIGSAVQDRMAPADPANLTGNHRRARFAFWTVLLGGTAAGVGIGHEVGSILDSQKAINRIERSRAQLRAQQDSTSRNTQKGPLGRPLTATH